MVCVCRFVCVCVCVNDITDLECLDHHTRVIVLHGLIYMNLGTVLFVQLAITEMKLKQNNAYINTSKKLNHLMLKSVVIFRLILLFCICLQSMDDH